MLRLNEETRVALRMVQLLRKSTEPKTAEKIAKKVGSTPLMVTKVAQRLIKKRVLDSERGHQGGFVIKDKTASYSVFDVMRFMGRSFRKPKNDVFIDAKIMSKLYESLSNLKVR